MKTPTRKRAGYQGFSRATTVEEFEALEKASPGSILRELRHRHEQCQRVISWIVRGKRNAHVWHVVKTVGEDDTSGISRVRMTVYRNGEAVKADTQEWGSARVDQEWCAYWWASMTPLEVGAMAMHLQRANAGICDTETHKVAPFASILAGGSADLTFFLEA